MYQIHENNKFKILSSPNYNFVFGKNSGFFARWGATRDDDPEWSPFGPEILDLEISTGECLGRCSFCYKENGRPRSTTHHMTLDTFKSILRSMPETLTQIAFGITDIYANPDFFEMMKFARENGVVPNYTMHGLDLDDYAAKLTSELCGAVAVSIVNRERAYDAVKRLTDSGMKQVNIHFMLSSERIDNAMRLVYDIKIDPRLAGLNAVVFLQYKPKGDSTHIFHSPSLEDFAKLINHCDSLGVRYGFDSCTATMYLKVIEGREDYKQLSQYAEPCESGLFSAYINANGEFYPCSFCENRPGWRYGMSVLDVNDFIDIWQSPRLNEWRNRLLSNNRACTMYELGDGCSKPLYDIKCDVAT